MTQQEIFKAQTKIDEYREMLKRAKEDIEFIRKILNDVQSREDEIRKEYRNALTEYDNLTLNQKRRFR